LSFLLVIELGLAILLAAGLVHWRKQRRRPPSRLGAARSRS
jgi:hypothetical protein